MLGSPLIEALTTPLGKWKNADVAAATSPVQYVDVAQQAGLTIPNVWGGVDHKRSIIEAKGSGLAFFDYDHDGWLDIYLTNGDRLDAHWPSGKAPTSQLYKNNRDGTFTDVTEKSGLGRTGWQTGVCVGDYNNDGWDDLFCCFWGHNILFRNNGDGTFTDVTAKSGIAAAPGRGLGSAFNDYDQDGWPDILVANDAIAEQLFHNNRDGTFSEVGLAVGLAYDEDGHAFSGMGVAFEDYDNDGWPDIFIDDLANQKYALFRNMKGAFQYVSNTTGVARMTMAHSGWGTALFDYDNDGWKDLFVAQSHVMDNIEYFQGNVRYLEPLLLLRNVQGRFEDVSARSGEPTDCRTSGTRPLRTRRFRFSATAAGDNSAMPRRPAGSPG
jgi:hypothetical protein